LLVLFAMESGKLKIENVENSDFVVKSQFANFQLPNCCLLYLFLFVFQYVKDRFLNGKSKMEN
jgi:hypothetical protein